MSSLCVFSCSHPLWGGGGICYTTDDPHVQDSCACDPGYASHDSFGHPSCVPRKVLVAIYMVLAVAIATAWVFSLWHLAQFRKLHSTARSARRNCLRLHLVIAGSVSHGGAALTFCTAAARGGKASLWDNGMFYVFCLTVHPPMMVCIASSVELWLESIPSQLVAPGGFLAKLREMAVERNSFILGGFSHMGGMVLLILSALAFGENIILTTIHLATLAGGVSLPIVSTSASIFLIRAIDSAESKAPQAWHRRARNTVRRQGIMIFLAGTVSCAALAVLELTNAGRSTPIVPFAVASLVGTAGVDAVIHFTRPSASGRTSAPPSQSPNHPAATPLLKLGSTFNRSTRRIGKLLSSTRPKASFPATSVAVGVSRDSDLHAGGGGDGGDGGFELGATGALPLRQKGTPSSDGCPIAIRTQTGGKGRKVVPVTAESV